MGKTVDALRLAEGMIRDNGDIASSFSLLLFPLSQAAFDNRVFSRSDTIVDVNRTPLQVDDSEFQKVMYGFMFTFRIALTGQTRSMGEDAMALDPINIFN